MGTLLVVTGTGTEIGKTHVSCALLHAWERSWGPTARVGGVKPVESGVPEGAVGADAASLAAATMFHVKHPPPPYALLDPVSPHLAARAQGIAIDLRRIVEWVTEARTETDGLLVELPGGLFSPLAPPRTNADLVAALQPDHTILVAPDRLGVLHDVAASDRAARAMGVELDGVVLSPPHDADASTGRNAEELPTVTTLPVWATLPRASVADLAVHPAIVGAVRRIRRP